MDMPPATSALTTAQGATEVQSSRSRKSGAQGHTERGCPNWKLTPDPTEHKQHGVDKVPAACVSRFQPILRKGEIRRRDGIVVIQMPRWRLIYFAASPRCFRQAAPWTGTSESCGAGRLLVDPMPPVKQRARHST